MMSEIEWMMMAFCLVFAISMLLTWVQVKAMDSEHREMLRDHKRWHEAKADAWIRWADEWRHIDAINAMICRNHAAEHRQKANAIK